MAKELTDFEKIMETVDDVTKEMSNEEYSYVLNEVKDEINARLDSL